MSLSNSQRRYLRGLAHGLKPVVLIGGKGYTPAVRTELDGALAHHELVKVKIAAEDREERKAIAAQLAGDVEAESIQTIGNMVVLFRRNADEPKIELPR